MLILNCARCGQPMPPIDDDTDEGKELARILRTSGIAPAHEVCPTPETAAAMLEEKQETKQRYFEARVQIVEVVKPDHDLGMVHDFSEVAHSGFDAVGCPPNCPARKDARTDELASFIVGTEAVHLPAAMRPLALELGKEWMKVEAHAGIADAGPGREEMELPHARCGTVHKPSAPCPPIPPQLVLP